MAMTMMLRRKIRPRHRQRRRRKNSQILQVSVLCCRAAIMLASDVVGVVVVVVVVADDNDDENDNDLTIELTQATDTEPQVIVQLAEAAMFCFICQKKKLMFSRRRGSVLSRSIVRTPTK